MHQSVNWVRQTKSSENSAELLKCSTYTLLKPIRQIAMNFHVTSKKKWSSSPVLVEWCHRYMFWIFSQLHLAIAKAHLLAATEGMRSCNCSLQALAETKILKESSTDGTVRVSRLELGKDYGASIHQQNGLQFTSFSGWLKLTTWKSKLMSWIEKFWTSLNSSIFSLLLTFASRHSEPTKSSPEFVSRVCCQCFTTAPHQAVKVPQNMGSTLWIKAAKTSCLAEHKLPTWGEGLEWGCSTLIRFPLTHKGTFKNGLTCAHVSCSSLNCHLLQSIFWAVFPSLWTDLLKRSPGLWTTGHT